MRHKKKILPFLLIVLAFAARSALNAQILYAHVTNANDNSKYIYQINVATCELCPLITLPSNGAFTGNDLVVLPDGNILLLNGTDGTNLFDPPNPNPISSFPLERYLGGVLAPNGLVYLSTADFSNLGLATYNPAIFAFTFIGLWPPNILVEEMFYWNGILYGSAVDLSTNQTVLLQINVVNPTLSVVVQNSILGVEGLCSVTMGAGQGIYHAGPPWPNQQLSTYDIATNALTTICDFSALNISIDGLSSLPPGVTPPGCNTCTTDAGTITAQSLTNYCVNVPATFTHNNNATLDANDLLRYVLFSNPSDTAGSIIATSTTPSFTFAPPMQTGVTYYLAAVAGNNVGGNVDLSDPCLDFSNANPMVWRPLPTVTFSVANPNVCAGACTTVTATFTGTAPFTLTYTTPASGSTTQTFSSNSGTFQVCTPMGSLPGSWVVQATKVVDAWCMCE